MRGSLIVFESCDGGGKTTQIARAVKHISDKIGQENVVQTKDPGGTKLGDCIRKIIYEEVPTHFLKPGVVDLLFFASHLQNWLEVVKPALEAGKVVVSDRWWYSQIAYATERPLVPKKILEAYEACHGDGADLLIFLSGKAELLYERANARTTETHQSAKSWNDVETLRRIQERYKDLFFDRAEWFHVYVGDQTQDEIWKHIVRPIDRLLEARERG